MEPFEVFWGLGGRILQRVDGRTMQRPRQQPVPAKTAPGRQGLIQQRLAEPQATANHAL
ncbi:hypothetical protein [Roseateles sp.]|uniref:hypothetical protein n=1 Tax=Roseateles sp. TaxID=1971397 RepID=UPI0039EB2042